MDPLYVQGSRGRLIARAAISFNEDDSGSDVSASPPDLESSPYTVQEPQAGPTHKSAPTPDPKPHLQPENLSAIKQRLAELDAVEDGLLTKRCRLIDKRKRKDERVRSRFSEEDERIKRQREEEDERIKRQREEEDERIKQQREEEYARRVQKRSLKEERIRKRREGEDAEYRKKEKAHDDEEYELRRRLKNLKRRLPVDDEITGSPRDRAVSESKSPPAKKHQPNPMPSQTPKSPARHITLQPLQPLQQEQQPAAQFPLYYNWNPPPPPPPPLTGPYPYGPSEIYQPQNQPNQPTQPAQPDQPTQPDQPNQPQCNPLPSNPLPNGGLLRFNPPPPPTRHGPSPKPNPSSSHVQSPRHQALAAPPPGGPSHYDVRPPAATSNFTSINAPPSGFPSINQPSTHGMKTPIQPASKPKRAHPSSNEVRAVALEAAVHHSPTNPPGDSPTASTPILGGKRKASTTHPYSQSEAFANRHHHCERTDELDRGIWTYFGPGGTKEAPTVAGKKEMYLRCNHDDCMRIDWKTVHGLQCHIVKNHGISKGTIGSLELAIEKYGVEAQEIEDYEKKHGLGSAGTMAEKGSHGRPRSRPSKEMAMPPTSGPSPRPTTASVSMPSTKTVSAVRPKPTAPIVLFPNLQARSPSGGYIQDDIVYSEEESGGDDSSTEVKDPAPRKRAGQAQRKPSDSEFSTPSTSKASGDDDPRQLIPRSAPTQHERSLNIDRLKSPEPRPTSSTETLAITDSAPTSTDSLPFPSPTKLPLHSITQHTPPMGTQTQRIVSAADRVNARLEAEDPDFVNTPAEGDVQTQTPKQTQSTGAAGTLPTSTKYITITTNTTTTSSSSATSSRPRSGAERRVPASERWDWAPIEDDSNGNSGSTKMTDNNNNGKITLTKAQQELQGIDGSVEEGAGEDRGGGGGGGEVDERPVTTVKSPATTFVSASRYSARKKTRRRVDG